MKPGFNFKCPHDEFAHVNSKASEQILSLAELAFCWTKRRYDNSHEFHLQSSVWTSSSQWDWKLSHEMGANGQPVKDGAQTFSKPWNCTALRKRRQEQKCSPNVEYNESTLLPSLKRDLLLCGVFRFTIRNNEKVRIIRYPLQIHW